METGVETGGTKVEPRWNHSGNLGGTKLETGAKKRKLE